MIVRRFFDPKLAQTSYLLGCSRTGSAIIIDPNRDVDQYMQAASAAELTITHVTETHIHADFVSGSRELAARTGAMLYLSDEGGADWRYSYAQDAGATLVKDGATFFVGNIRLDVVHTPGHTPEHISFLVTDTAAADAPIAIVTGDFVFVGDVGRPDLLERAAHIRGTMEQSARTLFHSLQRFKAYPDWLQIWPGHGAGSACGKGLSAIPHSTVGYERRFNWAFGVDDEEQFVRMVLAGQPEPPVYFAVMKRINKAGPPIRREPRLPPALSVSALDALLSMSAVIVDTRRATDYAAGYVPGTLNIPYDKQFTTWAGWLLPYDRDIYLIIDERRAADAIRDLAMIGLDRVAGRCGLDVIADWEAEHARISPLMTIPQMTAADVAEEMRCDAVTVVDVRGRAEWESEHIAGVANIPVGELVSRLAEIPRDKPIVLQCQSGARAAIAASVLRLNGVRDVQNLIGGISAWKGAGYPTVAEQESLTFV